MIIPFILCFFTLLSAADYEEIPNSATLSILTPSLSSAKTLKIRLNNGLEAYLFSDPNADKSAAALTVLAGSWDEPESEPGLAHFLEHMLFLGNKKYPNEAEYHSFISQNGGEANAFTAESSTSFLFSINNRAFPEALDRFSSFFKEPLFNPSGVSRELNAINQEYAKNLNNDNFRELFVLKTLADPQHPFSRFNMGNLSSLSHVSQETLKEWYRNTYSANLMRLAVLSPLPLDQLRDLVVADFKEIPNLNRPAGDLTKDIFFLQKSPQIVYIEPIKNVRTVTLLWDLPSQFAHMKETKPDTIVCYVLGHEGKKSLLAQLKREKLAERITCGTFQLGPSKLWMSLEVGLTDKGLKELNKVIERCFQTIARFREKGTPQYLFDEVKQLATLHYQYQPRQDAFDTMMNYASWMARENMETFPQGIQVIEKFDPKAVEELLHFMTPQNCHIDVLAPSTLTAIPYNHIEPWMNVSYATIPIAPEVMKTWEEAKPTLEIDLPEPNPYIPKNLTVTPGEKSETLLPTPKLIVDNKKGKIYFATDAKFFMPYIGWQIAILTPDIRQGNAQQLALGDLYLKNLNETFNEYRYPASLADLNCDLRLTDNGFAMSIEGYSDKAPLLLKDLLQQFKNRPADEQHFKVYKESLLREYQNFGKDNPIELAQEYMQSILYRSYSTDKEKATALRKIGYPQFVEFVEKLFAKSYIQGVLYGNMTESAAKEVAETLMAAFPGEAYPEEQHFKREVLLLPEEKGPFYVDMKVPTKGNVCWLTLEDAPPFSFKKRAALQILMQEVNAPFFDDLRTKQQTGYLVFSGPEELERKLFGYFVVQSDSHSGRDLLARFELFLERYLQEAPHTLTEEHFTTLKQAQMEILRQSVKNVNEMSKALNLLAFKYDADFGWLDKRLVGLKEVTMGECLNFAKQLFGKQNRRRLSLMLNGQLLDGTTLNYMRVNSLQQLRKLGEYEGR